MYEAQTAFQCFLSLKFTGTNSNKLWNAYNGNKEIEYFALDQM